MLMSQSSKIHPTAVVDDKAQIGINVEIGPYCIIGPDVKIGNNVRLRSHVNIDTHCEIGDGTQIYPFVSISDPQDLKFNGEKSKVIIGKNNTIREYVTIQPGTAADRMETRVGDNCLLMVSVHIAHDCIVGNNVIMANNASLAGHVVVEDNVIIGGMSAIRQKLRIGRNAMIGGMTGVAADVIPYGLVMGERGHLSGLNVVGLDRAGKDRQDILELRKAFKSIFENDDTVFAKRVEQVAKEHKDQELVQDIIKFINGHSEGAICQPRAQA